MKHTQFIIALTLLAASPAFAGFTRVAGNTRPHTPNGVGGTINFAVMYWEGGNSSDSFGTGLRGIDERFVPGSDAEGFPSPPLDTEAKYLYLYQTVNDGNFNVDIDSTAIPIYAEVTSWGQFVGASLADDMESTGKLTPVSAEHSFGPPAIAGAPSPALTGKVRLPGTLALESLFQPQSVTLFTNKFVASFPKPHLIKPKGVSTLFGFTSDYPPMMAPGTIQGFKDKFGDKD